MHSRFIILIFAVSFLATTSARRPAYGDDADEFARQMNLGKAHLENRAPDKAVTAMAAALELVPNAPAALRNLARAHLLARRYDKALEALAQVGRIEPESATLSYLSGLAHLRLLQFDQAVAQLERAVSLDARTATLRFQLASAYLAANREADAVTQLRETLRLDPLHGSAHYRLAMQARKTGDLEEFRRRIREFTRLRSIFGDATRSAAVLEQCVHTQPEGASPAAAPEPPTIEVRFTDVTDAAFGAAAPRMTSACVIDVDQSGVCTLAAVDPAGKLHLLKMTAAGKVGVSDVGTGSPAAMRFEFCAAGNYHDDVPPGERYDPSVHALTDVLLGGSEGIRLLKRSGPRSFDDTTAKAGLTGLTAISAHWIDYEHDGDLDLLLGRRSGLELWQNNGDGTFSNVTERVGIKTSGGVTDIAVADLDGNNAIDMIAARGDQPTLVTENQRAGRFTAMVEPPGPWPPADRVLLDDLDNDGRPDVVLLSDSHVTVLYGGGPKRDRMELTGMDASGAVLFDYDNDGRLDLCVYGRLQDEADRGVLRLWRNTARTGWKRADLACGLAQMRLRPIRDAIAVDLDGDADTDLMLITTDDAPHILRNDGGNANGQLKLRLVADKTNRSGIGTRVEVRQGRFRSVRFVSGQPVEIGLAGRKKLDSVQTVWTNGVVQNQIDVAYDPQPLRIVEKNVPTGSCPFLYAWDGREFRFVTDLLGNSPVGLPLTRDTLLPADPDEYVTIGGADAFQPVNGAYQVEVTSEFREVLYLDHAQLVAIDHPLGSEVHPTDKLMPPPFPVSQNWVLHKRVALRSAVGDDGIDRTQAFSQIDGAFGLPGAPLPPPLRGMCQPLTLTLEFARLDPSRPLVLALTGWLQYGDASTNIALSQNKSLEIIPPRLDVETVDGWTPVNVVVGMPAGKTKTILIDLSDRLPPGALRLRLTTTFEIRWDRAALFERYSADDTRIHQLPVESAELRWRGFSRLHHAAVGHPLTPLYADLSQRPPWQNSLQGWCTRYGDVLELVQRRDARLVLINGGDALRLQFDASGLPDLADGMQRTFAFYSVGWDKDGDHNVVSGDSVVPYPDMGDSSTTHDDWRLRYNTRWVPRDRFAPARIHGPSSVYKQ